MKVFGFDFGIPLIPPQVRLALYAVAVALVFGCGWMTKGWKDDAQQAREVAAIQKAIDAFRKHESNVAQTLENKLAQLSANQKILEVHRETIVTRPVYKNICLDDEGVALINRARLGLAATGSPSRSASSPVK